MKQTVLIFSIILALFAGSSCSDEFLSKNNADFYTLPDTLLMDNINHTATVMFELPEEINTDFTVFMRPRWLTVPSPRGEVNGGRVELSLSIDGASLPYGYYSHSGLVVLDIEEFGFVSLTVIFANHGSPSIHCSPNEIIFDNTLSETIALITPTEGVLDWEITGIPDWLTFSMTSGTIGYGETAWITVTLDADEIVPGTALSATVWISSPHATSQFVLKITVTPSAVPHPEGLIVNGILTDAEYHHNSGLMAICSKSPDRLFLYNTITDLTDTIYLDKSPVCVSISEDGHRAVVGYSVAVISHIDLDNREIIADYNIDCVPYDLVVGENNWCYITPESDQWTRLRNLDLNTGQLIVSPSSTLIYEQTLIRKVPGKSFLAGSQTSLSPTSLLIFDVTEGQAKDALSTHHEYIGSFWLSKNGARIYTMYRQVYNLPEYDGQYHSDELSLFGNINTDQQHIHALDDCPAIKSLFAYSAQYWFDSGNSTLIEQFSTSSLQKIRSFNVSPEMLNLVGTIISYETTPRHIFVNSEGTTMCVIKILKPDYNIDGWFIEEMDL